MKRKITAALTALTLIVSSITANNAIFTKTVSAKEEIKSFTKVENPDGIRKNTIQESTESTTYAPDEEVTVIVELNDIPLLEHYEKSGTANFARSETSFDQYATTNEADTITNKLLDKQEKVADQINSLQPGKNTAEILYHYTAVMNGFALKIKYKSLNQIRNLPSVKAAYVAGKYEKIEPVMDSSTKTIDAVSTWDLGYKGEETAIAILDTGLDTNHSGFQTAPSDPKFTESAIQNKITNSNGLKSGITDAKESYVNSKIPYAYDYADRDTNVIPSAESVEKNNNDHGTHVAGTIAAPEGDTDGITGVAPEAQLLIMKVFSDRIGEGGAYTEVILAALDDTVTLGADVINMSLGSASGFTDEGEESVNNVYNRIAAAGINLSISAGNSYSSTYNNGLGGRALTDNPDTSVVGSPSTYSAATSVASVINTNYHSAYFTAGGKKITYTETAAGSQPTFAGLATVTGSAVTVTGSAIEYAVVPGAGDKADYAGIDVKGKIALVKRGSISFNDKVVNARKNGAAGIVIYNNQAGTISMSITDYLIPAVSITQEDGSALLALEDKKLIPTKDTGTFPSDTAGQASGFSSWGVTPDLKLKPEIAAPGENIYSTVPFNKYASMSGTSMAAPHIAGSFALVKQYLKTTEKFKNLSEYDKAELANDLLMSTAIPARNSSGTYYSPRKQGSGVVNVFNAVNTDAYLYVDKNESGEPNERPKLNLGDNISKNGVFTKSFHVRNVSGSAITFTPETTVLTESTAAGVTISEVPYDITSGTLAEISVNGTPANAVSLQPYEDATVTLTLKLSDKVKEYLNTNFANGEFIDGFVILNSGETNIDLSLPFMGFYGDWLKAPIFDSGSANDLQGYQQTIHALYTNGGNNYLGVNPFDDNAYELIGVKNPYLYLEDYVKYHPAAAIDKIAISPNGDGDFDSFDIAQLSLLRNAKSLDWSLVNKKTNAAIDSDILNFDRKTSYSSSSARIVPTFIQGISWDGTDENGKALENDSQVIFTVKGELDYNQRKKELPDILSFPITVDTQKPALTNVTETKDGLQISVTDNQYVSAVFLCLKENLTKPVASLILNEDKKGTVTKINVDYAQLGLSGKTASDLVVILYDYAMNNGAYALGQTVTPTPTDTVTPTPTHTVTPSPTATVTPAPTDTVTPAPTGSVTPSPTVTMAPTSAATPVPYNPPVTSSPNPTAAPALTPSVTPSVTAAPTNVPSSDLLKKVTVNPKSTAIFTGKTWKIKVKLPNTLTKTDVVKITYFSDNVSVAGVSQKGTISGLKAGTAFITTNVSINGTTKKFKTKVTVKNPSITFLKQANRISVGKTYTYKAKGYGTTKKITYQVSKKNLATIDSKTGKLKARKPGTLTVTAKSGSVTAQVKVTILKK